MAVKDSANILFLAQNNVMIILSRAMNASNNVNVLAFVILHYNAICCRIIKHIDCLEDVPKSINYRKQIRNDIPTKKAGW